MCVYVYIHLYISICVNAYIFIYMYSHFYICFLLYVICVCVFSCIYIQRKTGRVFYGWLCTYVQMVESYLILPLL